MTVYALSECIYSLQIQDGKGDVTITNDGATILKQMQVLHPAAKMVNHWFGDIILYLYNLKVLNDIV